MRTSRRLPVGVHNRTACIPQSEAADEVADALRLPAAAPRSGALGAVVHTALAGPELGCGSTIGVLRSWRLSQRPDGRRSRFETVAPDANGAEGLAQQHVRAASRPLQSAHPRPRHPHPRVGIRSAAKVLRHAPGGPGRDPGFRNGCEYPGLNLP